MLICKHENIKSGFSLFRVGQLFKITKNLFYATFSFLLNTPLTDYKSTLKKVSINYLPHYGCRSRKLRHRPIGFLIK